VREERLAELRRWLAEVGLESLAETLETHDVGLDILGELTDADLREIGLTLGQRKRLLKARSARRVEPIAPATHERGTGEAERRQMTIVFCDMVGSTALSSRLDPEDMFVVVAAYQRCCMEVIKEHGGYVAQYLGDGVLAYFGFPLAREDDAERAVRAGLALVEAVRRLKPRPDVNLHARIGIDTGLVVIGDLLASGIGNEDSVVGDTPNFAARLQTAAPPDGVVISENTRRLLGSLFEFAVVEAPVLKGFSSPGGVWQVTGEGRAEGRFEARSAAGLTPMIGREHELRMMLHRWDLARVGEGQVLLLTGEGGIGKSRLVDTLNSEMVDEPHIRLRYFCSQFYASTPLYPIIEQIRRAAGFTRQDDAETQLDRLDRCWSMTTIRSARVGKRARSVV
jgi:class 3 adenylate cyclase